MCRNIKILFNFDPPATKEEVRAASEQYVRKVSGYTHPSQINEPAFEKAVSEVAAATQKLMGALVTTAEPKNREEEAHKAHLRAVQRFGKA